MFPAGGTQASIKDESFSVGEAAMSKSGGGCVVGGVTLCCLTPADSFGCNLHGSGAAVLSSWIDELPSHLITFDKT